MSNGRPPPPAAVSKQNAQENWKENPCGANYADADPASREYFDQVEAHRYASHPWIREDIRSLPLAGKRVLEIGYGMGTDHLQLARQGARLFGIDLTANNAAVTRRRFALYQQETRLTVGDAEHLPFADNSFDVVYSFGVIHHTPDIAAAVAEIHRVLKPGGLCHVTVYHQASIFLVWSTLAVNFLLRGGFRRNTLREQLSLIEYPNINKGIVMHLHTRRRFHARFRRFARVRSWVCHLLPADILLFERFFKDPFRATPLLDWLGKRFGWYVVVRATKASLGTKRVETSQS